MWDGRGGEGDGVRVVNGRMERFVRRNVFWGGILCFLSGVDLHEKEDGRN